MNAQPTTMQSNNSPWTEVYQASKPAASTNPSTQAQTASQNQANDAATAATHDAMHTVYNLPH